MTAREVRITGDGTRGAVTVDGHDLAGAVERLSYEHRGGYLPQVELELTAHTVEIMSEANVRVLLTDDVRKALVVLGWTPPAGETL